MADAELVLSLTEQCFSISELCSCNYRRFIVAAEENNDSLLVQHLCGSYNLTADVILIDQTQLDSSTVQLTMADYNKDVMYLVQNNKVQFIVYKHKSLQSFYDSLQVHYRVNGCLKEWSTWDFEAIENILAGHLSVEMYLRGMEELRCCYCTVHKCQKMLVRKVLEYRAYLKGREDIIDKLKRFNSFKDEVILKLDALMIKFSYLFDDDYDLTSRLYMSSSVTTNTTTTSTLTTASKVCSTDRSNG